MAWRFHAIDAVFSPWTREGLLVDVFYSGVGEGVGYYTQERRVCAIQNSASTAAKRRALLVADLVDHVHDRGDDADDGDDYRHGNQRLHRRRLERRQVADLQREDVGVAKLKARK